MSNKAKKIKTAAKTVKGMSAELLAIKAKRAATAKARRDGATIEAKNKIKNIRTVKKVAARKAAEPTPVKDAALAFIAGAGTTAALSTSIENSKRKAREKIANDAKIKKRGGDKIKNRNMGGVIGGGLGSQDVVSYLYDYKN